MVLACISLPQGFLIAVKDPSMWLWAIGRIPLAGHNPNGLPAILEASCAGPTLLPIEAPFFGRLKVLLPTLVLKETHDSVIAFLSPLSLHVWGN